MGPRLWRPDLAAVAEMHEGMVADSEIAAIAPTDYWDQARVVLPEGTPVELRRGRRDRYLLLFWLDAEGQLWHCASGMAVTVAARAPGQAAATIADAAAQVALVPLTLAKCEAPCLRWRLRPGQALVPHWEGPRQHEELGLAVN